MLVEVIMGKKTGDPALATALDFVRAIGKTPIVVNDSRGFYTSRVVTTFIREGHLMLTEGVPAAMVENAARMAGMPVGPLSLNDETALDLSLRIMDAARTDLGAGAVPDDEYRLIAGMVSERGRLGRKNGKGFYDYPQSPGGKKRLWPGLTELLPPSADPASLDVAGLKARFLAIMALETARCFAEGVLTDVREADVGSVLGFGFPPFTGGTLSYIDFMGAAEFVALLATPQPEAWTALPAEPAAQGHGEDRRNVLPAISSGSRRRPRRLSGDRSTLTSTGDRLPRAPKRHNTWGCIMSSGTRQSRRAGINRQRYLFLPSIEDLRHGGVSCCHTARSGRRSTSSPSATN